MAEPAEVQHPMTLEAYLEEGTRSPVRHELVRSFPRAVAGASRRHSLLVAALFPQAREKGCRVPGETF